MNRFRKIIERHLNIQLGWKSRQASLCDPSWVSRIEKKTHRNLYIEINGVKLVITAGVCFPQGGVCSAKFWVIAYYDAVHILNKYKVFGQVFADDSIAMKGGRTYIK